MKCFLKAAVCLSVLAGIAIIIYKLWSECTENEDNYISMNESDA